MCCNGTENEVQLGALLTLQSNDSNKTSLVAKVLFKVFQLHQAHNSPHTLFILYYSSREAFTHA